jgi:dTMP kinase
MAQIKTAQAPFLVFEGLDGSGKSTLINAVSLELKNRGLRFQITREPGGTPMAEEIRKIILRCEGETPVPPTELLLYAASRAQHVEIVIKPALNRGEWVLCDRFSASTVSFQCFARGLNRVDIDWLNRYAQQGLEPDLYILLDLSVEESAKRQTGRQAQGQNSDRMEREAKSFHQKVREGYLAQATEQPQNWLVLDAAQSPARMAEQVMACFRERQWLA